MERKGGEGKEGKGEKGRRKGRKEELKILLGDLDFWSVVRFLEVRFFLSSEPMEGVDSSSSE